MKNLKPCPFCGSHDCTIERVLRDGCEDGEIEAWAYYVACPSCGAQGGWGKSEGTAEHHWNMREKV